MIRYSHSLRVRYSDTDQMGFVYHGRFVEYLEAARTEMIRHWGLTYKSMEQQGVLMPVSDLELKYKAPARYDDLLRIDCILKEKPSMRLAVHYEIYNAKDVLLTEARVRLAFLDAKTMKVMPCPEFFMDVINQAWED